MIGFGEDDPREMPSYLFSGSLRLDDESAVRANTDNQNRGVCPRYWYVEAIFRCARCRAEFLFTVPEQRTWYEKYGFYVDAFPKRCLECRRAVRNLKDLRKEYDRNVKNAIEDGDLELKKKTAATIDQLYEIGGDLPARINENRQRLGRQIAKLEEAAP